MRSESEDLDFLGAQVARSEQAQIVEFAALGRPAVEQGVGEHGEPGFAEESRNQGGNQDHQEPGREPDDAGREREECDELLGHRRQHGEHSQAAGRLASGALQLVVEDRILERDQVQLIGVLHHANADVVREAVTEEAVAESNRAREDVARNGECDFDAEQFPYAAVIAAVDHQVDDQLSHPQHGHRDQRVEEAKADGSDGQGRTGIPDHAEQRRDVSQRPETVAPPLRRLALGWRRVHSVSLAGSNGRENSCEKE